MKKWWWPALFIITSDQITKWWIADGATHNFGISLGLFSSSSLVTWFVLTTLSLTLILTWHLRHQHYLAIGLLYGGGMSNFFDRLWFKGAVRDWLSVGWGISNNLADWAIIAAIGLLLYDLVVKNPTNTHD